MIINVCQKGSALVGFFVVIASMAIGAFIFRSAFSFISDGQIIIPWALVSIVLLPVTMAIQLIPKLIELKEQKSLTNSERRRLNIIVEEKIWQARLSIYYNFTSAIVFAGFFSFTPKDHPLFGLGIMIIGSLLGASIASIWLVERESKELFEFKAKLAIRLQAKENQKSALKRLSTDEDSSRQKNHEGNHG